MIDLDLARMFRHGERIGDAVMEVRTIGQLHVSSGRIVACDPLVNPESEPFTRQVPTGVHAVDIAIARFPNEDERIAAARVTFGTATPTDWKLALVGNQDESTLGPGRIFGYPVDAGLGCFMDLDSAPLYNERLANQKPDY